MFCDECGKELPDGSRFCKFCGTDLTGKPQGAGPPQGETPAVPPPPPYQAPAAPPSQVAAPAPPVPAGHSARPWWKNPLFIGGIATLAIAVVVLVLVFTVFTGDKVSKAEPYVKESQVLLEERK
ncbi:MAG: zinc ribbon domain-containing protein, partial [Actinomycetota bacterium]|nr:zinc ribbon domain-containing protein [Actinomycetota bacterium]